MTKGDYLLVTLMQSCQVMVMRDKAESNMSLQQAVMAKKKISALKRNFLQYIIKILAHVHKILTHVLFLRTCSNTCNIGEKEIFCGV